MADENRRLFPVSRLGVKQLFDFFLFACLLNYIIWVIVIIPDLARLDFKVAATWLFEEAYQAIIETAILFFFSMCVSYVVARLFWKGSHTWNRLGVYAFILFVSNFLLAFCTSFVYRKIWPNSDDLFIIRIVAVDGTVISFISAALIALFLLNKNSEEREKAEKMKIEAEANRRLAIRARLDLLSLEIDPHYVFNGLSTLSGLIEEDTHAAEKFLGLFSKTFRYLLDNKDKRVMDVRDEYDFANQYGELISYRYDHVTLNMDPAIRQLNGLIPTASLELLIENAVKHNCHTEEKELIINIYYKDGYIAVENNLNPLSHTIPSTKIGLTNLCERYSYLSCKEPQIISTDSEFVVKIPVLYGEDLSDDIEQL